MKKIALLFTALMLLTGTNVNSEEKIKKEDASKQGSIQVLSSPELYELTRVWAEEYNLLNSGAALEVISAGSEKVTGLNDTGADIGFVTGNYPLTDDPESIWKIVVGRDVVVPVINAANPYAADLAQTGVTMEKLSALMAEAGFVSWGDMIAGGQNIPVQVYVLDDQTVISMLKKLAGLEKVPESWTLIKSSDDMITAVANDQYAIAFSKVAGIRNAENMAMVGSISLLPIDKNGNGHIDYTESIYGNLDQFTRGVWIGKYPRALYNDVYCISSGEPVDGNEAAFIKWVLTAGQKFLPMNGFTDLVYGERQSKLARFDQINIIQPIARNNYFLTPLIFIILGSILFLSLLISVIRYHRKSRNLVPLDAEGAVPLHFSGTSVNIPKGLYYDKTHTWTFMEKDGIVKIGIDDFLQHVTGPITRIQIRKTGEKVKKGDMILTIIQNGKRLIIHSPVSGTIVDNNKVLASDSSVINTSPYADGWIYRIEPANWLREIQFLDMAEKYKIWLNNEFLRLKDFLASSLKIEKEEYESVILQDGGILKDNVLEEFGPEVWEDFQAHFLDYNR